MRRGSVVGFVHCRQLTGSAGFRFYTNRTVASACEWIECIESVCAHCMRARRSRGQREKSSQTLWELSSGVAQGCVCHSAPHARRAPAGADARAVKTPFAHLHLVTQILPLQKHGGAQGEPQHASGAAGQGHHGGRPTFRPRPAQARVPATLVALAGVPCALGRVWGRQGEFDSNLTL